MEKEAGKRTVELLSGAYNYSNLNFIRDVDEPPSVLTIGSAQLLDYGQGNKNTPVVFLIPSLINRYYIMDLTQKLSFARYLRDNGIRVFIVDWGTPSDYEQQFNCADYITKTLVPMTDWIAKNTRGNITLGGYCMGGLLALALSYIRKDLVDNLALFATPWDFSASNFPRFTAQQKEIEILRRQILSQKTIPPEIIHILFHYANPFAFQQKLREFATSDLSSPTMLDFFAIESWANDGVAMTPKVAEDCFINWLQYNQPAGNEWKIDGQIINPKKLDIPCFIAAPKDDNIVPQDCALPLAGLLPDTTFIEPPSGHVGMMAGRQRKSSLWEPFLAWLKNVT